MGLTCARPFHYFSCDCHNDDSYVSGSSGASTSSRAIFVLGKV